MYQDLPIDVVRPADDNLRRRVGDVSDIVATIPTHGILEPLVVAPQDDGTYLIVAGHRRYAAATEAGLSVLPCVVKPMTDEERTLAALVENGSRRDLSPSEEAAGISRLCQAGWTLNDLAAAIGRTRKHVSGRLALLELPAAVRRRVDGGGLSIADAAELLKAKGHPEEFKQLCTAAAAGELEDVGWAVKRLVEDAKRQTKRASAMRGSGGQWRRRRRPRRLGRPPRRGRPAGLGPRRSRPRSRSPRRRALPRRGRRPGRQGPAPICTDPSRHTRKGASAVKVEPDAEAQRLAGGGRGQGPSPGAEGVGHHPPEPAGRAAGAPAAPGRRRPPRLRTVRAHGQPGSGQGGLPAARPRRPTRRPTTSAAAWPATSCSATRATATPGCSRWRWRWPSPWPRSA